VYADEPTWRIPSLRFGYCFVTPPGSSYPPYLTRHPITAGVPVIINGAGGGVSAVPLLLPHGDISALGFRFGAMAYTPDLVNVPEPAEKALSGIELWIVDALWYRPHPSHFHLDLALQWIERIRPKRAILTNMHSDLDYERLRAKLPAHIEPAYDGMRIEFEGASG
jgi:phosphoribosyl 1,2-cyclic phosphate phosphodiesterase